MAIKSIFGNKMRSFLTMLGVIIGVGAVITTVAFAQGSTKNITDTIQGMGTNLIQITIMGRNSNRNVTYSDLQTFASEHPGEISAIAPTVNSNATVKAGVKSRSTTILGTTPDYATIQNVTVQSGRFLLTNDVDTRQKVALVGTAVVNDIFAGQDPNGKDIKVNGEMFTVIGVLTEKAGGQTGSSDDIVIIPVTTAQRAFKNAVIRNFSVESAIPSGTSSLMDELNTFLLGIYKNSQLYRVINSAQLLSTLSSVTGTLMLVLGGIATISLVVGGIGIMNIMLVSVTERTREIGIRKAIGAKRRNILVQFLIESIIVTGIGGLIGVLVGILLIKLVIGGLKLVPEVYSLTWITVSFSISLFVGIVFGIFPAMKASKLNPVQALHFE